METTQPPVHGRRFTVYRSRGRVDELPLEPAPVEGAHHSRVADCTPLRSIMAQHDILCVQADLDIATVIHLIVDRHVGCLPVIDERRQPIGVITKFDLVEQLDAVMQVPGGSRSLPPEFAAETAEDVMMPLAMTLDENATIAHAAAMMMSEDTHHVLVVSKEGALVGVVSSKDIVRWVIEHDVLSVRRDVSGPPPWRPYDS